jgi:5-methyltetrahydropteroyltriglutamate--homocysteine methyltransferase
MQERAGLDYISDGEWRRENYARVFADSVGGFRRQQVQRGSLTLHAFVVDKLQPRGPIVSTAAEFLRRHTDRKTIVALPSPCTVGDLMWHPIHSAAAYPTREAFVRACVPILRHEVIALAGLGVDAVQLDEPLLPRLTDPQTYGYFNLADLQAAAALSVETINGVAEGLEEVYISVHLCHAHGEQYHVTPGTGALIMDAVKRMRVDRFAMEFNSPIAKQLQPLKAFPPDARLGLGVINPHSSEVETPETVVQRAERALQFVEKERLTLNPDCGFATTATSPRKLDDVYLKLAAMCQGARLLRDAYG